MRHIDPARLDHALEDVVTSMKRIFHDAVRSEDGVGPMFALLCTVDPRTGKPIERASDGDGQGLGAVFMVPSHFGNEQEKDHVAMLLRMIAVAGEAVASIACFDTWVAMGKAAEDHVRHGTMPSDHPDRIEAMVVMTEVKGRAPTLDSHPYHRLSDDLVFDDSVRAPSGATLDGRFASLLPPHEMPAKFVNATRALIAAGAIGSLTWEAM
jgi:hypothetical protein